MNPGVRGLLLALLAGSCTAVGGLYVFCVSRSPSRLLTAGCMAVAAGVMLYVTFVEVFQESREQFAAAFAGDEKAAYSATTGSFFGGWVLAHGSEWFVSFFERKYNDNDDYSGNGRGRHKDSGLCDDSSLEVVVSGARQRANSRRRRCCRHHPQEGSGTRSSGRHHHNLVECCAILPAIDSECELVDEVTAAVSAASGASPPDFHHQQGQQLHTHRTTACCSADPSPLQEAVDAAAAAGLPADLPVEEREAERRFAREQSRFLRTGIFTAVALTLHNLPEGIATYTGSLTSDHLAVGLTAAIGMHNIPEGLAVAVPLYKATRRRWQAFWWATLTGAAEPLGALLAFAFLRDGTAHPIALGVSLGFVAGIMANISLNELLLTAATYDPNKRVVPHCFAAGMVFIAATLVALKQTT